MISGVRYGTIFNHPFVRWTVAAISAVILAKVAQLAYQIFSNHSGRGAGAPPPTSLTRPTPPPTSHVAPPISHIRPTPTPPISNLLPTTQVTANQQQPPASVAAAVRTPPLSIDDLSNAIKNGVTQSLREFLSSEELYANVRIYLDQGRSITPGTLLFDPANALLICSVEQQEGQLPSYQLKVNFSRVALSLEISDSVNLKGANNAVFGNSLRKIIAKLNEMSSNSFSFSISEIDFSGTKCSMRALFREGFEDLVQSIKHDLKVLKLSGTQSSLEGFQFLHNLRTLKELEFDDCSPDLQNGQFQAQQFRNFHPCPSLEKMSLLGTSLKMGTQWLPPLQIIFPNVKKIAITQEYGPHTKTLGIADAATLSTAVEPQVIKCGHIFNLTTLQGNWANQCLTCRTHFDNSEKKAFKPRATVLTKQADGFFYSKVVDISGHPVQGKNGIHLTCGTIYNPLSLQEHYQAGQVSELFSRTLKCKGCDQAFTRESVKEVFIEAVSDDATTGAKFGNLAQTLAYTQIP